MVLPLIPVPLALVGLRHGYVTVAAAGFGLAVGSAVALWRLLPDASGLQIAALVLLAVWLSCGVAMMLVACRMGGPFQRAPLVAVMLAFAAPALVALVGAVSSQGVSGVRASANASLLEQARQMERRCEEAGLPARVREQTLACNLSETVREHARSTLMWVLPSFALVLLALSAVSLFAFRISASRRGLPVHRPAPLEQFRVHWSITYLVSAGIALLIVGLETSGADGLLAAFAAALIALSVALFCVQGIAVIAFLFELWKVRPWVRVAFWVICGLALNLSLLFFFSMGLGETVWRLRDRAAKVRKD